MRNDAVEVCLRLQPGFDGAHEALEAAKAFQFVLVVELGPVQRAPQEVERFVVRLQ